MDMIEVKLIADNLDVNSVLRRINEKAGAYVLFLGRVRNHDRGTKVHKLVYEAYLEMAEKEMRRIAEEAINRFGVLDVFIYHRYGALKVGEETFLVVVTSSHRREAFEACSWIVDQVKSRVPIWKVELTDRGAFWVEGNNLKPI